MTLNPLDIREIKVLKDAVATALYGVKAANGVLEISSRRGVSGPLSISRQYAGGCHATRSSDYDDDGY